MMLSVLNRISAIWLLLCCLVWPAQAQQATWSLRNTSNLTLHFETFDYQRGTWKQQVIYPNQTVNYSLSHGTSEGKFHINTQDRGFVEYRVEAGQSYTVGWDQQKGVWDLKFAHAARPDVNAQARSAQPQYSVYNASDSALTFETMDLARGTWRQQSLQSGESKNFTMSSGDVPGKIRIFTDGRGHVEYDVRNGWKYKVLWSQQKGVWDFMTVQKAGQSGQYSRQSGQQSEQECSNCRR
ncbi:hypothetical protein V8J88_04965 [Massilia sp. W12]|uniref:hypothetical protein n=1 Tax=Massilia sp. W12 TaxID=3126507 RepID=UPI0030CF025E